MSLVFPPLYAIIDAALLKTSELSFAELMAESWVEILQYRHKRATSRQLFETSRSLSAGLLRLTSGASRPRRIVPRLIVNDRADVALLARAGGVHVGQNDLGVEQARAIVGQEMWVGVSTHTLEQVEAAEKTSANYVAFGTIFATATKENPDPVVGLELLAQARQVTRKPLVAIGGITLERAAETYTAGADALAVARDLLLADDPGARARAFLSEAAKTRGRAPHESGGEVRS
jgi:thiamine-phosphate pyrophosphorylase